MVEWLDSLGISAYGKPAAPGVYVMATGVEAKIAALGLKVRNGCTYHGARGERRHGPRAVRRHRPLRLPGARGHAARRSRRRADRRRRRAPSSRRSSPRTSTDDGPPVTTPTDPAAANAAGVKHTGDGEDRAHPDQGRRRGAPEEARLDPRARAVVAALPRDQGDPARAPAAHGVRGSLVPEHRRMLRQGHRDVHDHGRHLHAALPVLRRRARPPAAARRRRARQSREDDRGAEARATS